MKQLVINEHLTSMRDCDKGDCVPCVADGAVGRTSRMVTSMVELEGQELLLLLVATITKC